MPEYLYEDPDTGKIVTVIQGINEEHKYQDPFNKSDFLNKTRGKKGSYGDLWDASKEASQKREEKLGNDPIKKKHFEKYSQTRNGMKHQQDK